MTKEELASNLNGCEYRSELEFTTEQELKDNGLIVIYGASDDLVELSGFVNDEIEAYQGAEFFLDAEGLLRIPYHSLRGREDDGENSNLTEDHWRHYFKRKDHFSKKVEAIWSCDEYSWTYETKIPHSCFDVMEDGEKYCRGIVVDIREDWGPR